MSGGGKLILGYWHRQPVGQLRRFIASLSRTTFNGDVCVFVDDVPVEFVQALVGQGIIVERAAPFVRQGRNHRATRYFCFHDFLLRRYAEYAQVMLADLNDVIFQADPFAQPVPVPFVGIEERRHIHESPEDIELLTRCYGEGVALNLRNFRVCCAGTSFGTAQGVLHYLTAMTEEIASRPSPMTGAMDQGVHNYVLRMRPPPGTWCDASEALVATMNAVAPEAVELLGDMVRVNGRAPAVLHRWARNGVTATHFSAPERLAVSRLNLVKGRGWSANDAVVAFYQRERDANWLPLCLASLRGTGFSGSVHCVGEFNDAERALLRRYGALAYQIDPVASELVENLAHFYLGQVLERIATSGATIDQVLLLDSTRAVFPRDPFANKAPVLSAFCEGAARIGDSDYNVHRLAFFGTPSPATLAKPVVSSAVLRGPFAVVRDFYARVFGELVGRSDLLNIQKSIQGAFNKLCYAGDFPHRVVVYPNGAEVYFDFWSSNVGIGTDRTIRVGGTTPGIVLGASTNSDLLQQIRLQLYLQDA